MSGARMDRQAIDLGVDADHPAYAGHFPGMPILPGAVLLDAALRRLGEAGCIDPACCEIASFKFHSPVRPAERPALSFERLAAGTIRITITAAGRTVATGVAAPRRAPGTPRG